MLEGPKLEKIASVEVHQEFVPVDQIYLITCSVQNLCAQLNLVRTFAMLPVSSQTNENRKSATVALFGLDLNPRLLW